VHVAAGDYRENLVIRKPVRLLGAGMGETRLLADMAEKGIEVRSSDVEIAGFSIVGQGEPDNENLFVAGIWAEDVDNLLLRDNEVGPYWMEGIAVGSGTGIRIENNRAFQISGFDYGESYGFYMLSVEDLVLKQNLAFDSTEGAGFYKVYISYIDTDDRLLVLSGAGEDLSPSWPGTPAEASAYGQTARLGSSLFNSLGVLLLPIGAIVLLRARRP
jgi:hypothetical protein